MLQAKPIVKMAGGKRQLLDELRCEVPQTYKHYYEPFFGGGALFFDLIPPKATIGDSNELLMRTYLGVRGDVEDVIEDLQKNYSYDEKSYYEERERHKFMSGKDNVEIAAWFIYINRSCFNGLWRVNSMGRLNTPFGRYTNPTLCDSEALRAAAKALKRVNIRIGDFASVVRSAEEGDLVYFDPPYVPASATANFVGYAKGGFNLGDQGRLRDCALQLKKLGVHVILSNSDTPEVRQLYRGFKIRRVEAKRNINSKGEKRGAVGEVIIT